MGSDSTHFAIFGQVDLQRLGVVFESQRGHSKEDILAIHSLALFLLTFLRRCDKRRQISAAGAVGGSEVMRDGLPSLVMKEMNSLTHSCMHSFASLAILAFSGKAVFMIRATGAKLRMLASEAGPCEAFFVPWRGEMERGELLDITDAEWSQVFWRNLRCGADHG